jgi:hypothetical protein
MTPQDRTAKGSRLAAPSPSGLQEALRQPEARSCEEGGSVMEPTAPRKGPRSKPSIRHKQDRKRSRKGSSK